MQAMSTDLPASLLAPLMTLYPALADELGTVREMVTRLLCHLEREGWVSLSRKSIHINVSAALRGLAAGQI